MNNGAPLFQNESYEHINRYEQRKKSSKKKKGLEPRITLRVISRLKPINQLFFYLFINVILHPLAVQFSPGRAVQFSPGIYMVERQGILVVSN